MEYITKMVHDFIEDHDDIKKTDVMEFVGMSESAYRDFFKKGKISFKKLIKFAQLISRETGKGSHEILSEWCLHITRTETIKNAFEYSAITTNAPLLKRLLLLHQNTDGVLKQTVEVYRIVYNYMVGTLSGFELKDAIGRLYNITSKPLLILMNIIRQYNNYFEGDIQKIINEVSEIQKDITNLGPRETFYKECLTFRVCELLAPISLQLNDVKSARDFAESIINANISAKKKSDAYYVIGMSYLPEDKNVCLYNLRKSYELMREVGDLQYIQEAKFNLDFAKVFHGVELDEDSNFRLRAYQKARNGKISLAKLHTILERGDKDNFIIFFENTAEKSIDVMYNCLESFFCQENFFFARLVAKELEKAGADSRALRPFLKFKKLIKGEVLIEKDIISHFNRSDGGSRICI